MKKKTNPISTIVMMAVIGVLISVFSSDFSISGILEELEIGTVDEMLDYINIGLGFLALLGVFIFFFIRAASDKKEYYWDFEKDDFRKED
jgi:hypothetical protein